MDLTNLISNEELLSLRGKPQKIFFYRICGTGMGAAASLARQMGYHIEGFDFTYYPPMSEYLKQEGIKTYNTEEFKPELLKKFDLIVVGNAVHRLSEHAQWIEKSGVKFTSFPSLLGTLVLKELNVVGVCGTHGKTTTTYLATQIFENLALAPGYLIGAILDGKPPAALSTKTNYFFIEGDEYDTAYFQKYSKFRCYELKSMILTSLEFDHADIFPTLEAIESEFIPVVEKLPGHFIAGNDYPSCHKVGDAYRQARHRIPQYYGKNSEVGPLILERRPDGTMFKLNWKGKELGFVTNLVGDHNIENLTSVCCFALAEGVRPEKLQMAMTHLELPRRRQELRGLYRGALVIDDFAHHPTAVIKTLQAITAKYPDKKIKIVLDPMSATSRSQIFQTTFADSFKGASAVAILKPKAATTVPGGQNLDVEKLAELTTQTLQIPASAIGDLPTLRSWIDNQADPSSLLLILSNNTSLGLWESDFVKALEK